MIIEKIKYYICHRKKGMKVSIFQVHKNNGEVAQLVRAHDS